MSINIKELSTIPPEDWKEKEGKKQTLKYLKKIESLQNILMASKNKSLLIILQGMDAAGKDSTIRKVLAVMNPIGMDVYAFKKPTELEMSHDFLWRALLLRMIINALYVGILRALGHYYL